MPVCVKPFDHQANSYSSEFEGTQNVTELVGQIGRLNRPDRLVIYDSSLGEHGDDAINPGAIQQKMQASQNGFLGSIKHAYNSHRHLILRPEDLWFQILTQFSCYVNKHSEELREHFVAHEGQESLCIEYSTIDINNFPYNEFADDISRAIQANVKDKGLREWLIPDFSTTTQHDRETACVIMMATMQRYFTYESRQRCGIPSVTLLGERADYENLLGRLDKLDQYGAEPARFAKILKPVIKNFVASFDSPESPEVVNFWRGIVNIRHGSGRTTYTGWIAAFCFWNEEGFCLHRYTDADDDPNGGYLDGVKLHTINHLPVGYAKVPILIDGEKAEMTAGSFAAAVSSSGNPSKAERWINGQGWVTEEFPEGGLDTLQPVSGWWVQKVQEAVPPGSKHLMEF